MGGGFFHRAQKNRVQTHFLLTFLSSETEKRIAPSIYPFPSGSFDGVSWLLCFPIVLFVTYRFSRIEYPFPEKKTPSDVTQSLRFVLCSYTKVLAFFQASFWFVFFFSLSPRTVLLCSPNWCESIGRRRAIDRSKDYLFLVRSYGEIIVDFSSVSWFTNG